MSNNPPYGAPGQPPYGAPGQPPYGAPGQPPYGAPGQPPYGAPGQPPYGPGGQPNSHGVPPTPPPPPSQATTPPAEPTRAEKLAHRQRMIMYFGLAFLGTVLLAIGAIWTDFNFGHSVAQKAVADLDSVTKEHSDYKRLATDITDLSEEFGEVKDWKADGADAHLLLTISELKKTGEKDSTLQARLSARIAKDYTEFIASRKTGASGSAEKQVEELKVDIRERDAEIKQLTRDLADANNRATQAALMSR